MLEILWAEKLGIKKCEFFRGHWWHPPIYYQKLVESILSRSVFWISRKRPTTLAGGEQVAFILRRSIDKLLDLLTSMECRLILSTKALIFHCILNSLSFVVCTLTSKTTIMAMDNDRPNL